MKKGREKEINGRDVFKQKHSQRTQKKMKVHDNRTKNSNIKKKYKMITFLLNFLNNAFLTFINKIRVAFNKFPDFFVQAFKIVVDS